MLGRHVLGSSSRRGWGSLLLLWTCPAYVANRCVLLIVSVCDAIMISGCIISNHP